MAHVAGPIVTLDRSHRFFGEAQAAALLVGTALEKGMGQQDGIAATFAQRRDFDDDFGQVVIQVFAESRFLDQRAQILVRGADHAHVDGDFLAPAQTLDLAFLQEAQQLGLQWRGQVADFLEKQGAAVGGFDAAQGGFRRTREGALFRNRRARFPTAFRESPRS